MRNKIHRGTVITLALLSATALGGVTAGTALAADTPTLNETAAVQSSFTPVGDFTNLVKRVTPAVVSIDVHLKLDQTADINNSGDGRSATRLPARLPARRRARAASGGRGQGVRLHHQPQRHHRHQQPRGQG